ncbi:MAG: hypothetical protein AB8G05_25750 [Oligoflexales bacterium]
MKPIKSIDYQIFFKLLKLNCDLGSNANKVFRYRTCKSNEKKRST